MSSTPSAGTNAVPAPGVPERRRNAALRALIDEMLFQVRGMQRDNEAWTPEERARAEAELDRIMARVRNAAVPGRSAGSNDSP
jgi:hypothetical protein